MLVDLSYLISAICFIYGLKMLSHPRTARNGNIIASMGMLIAIIVTVYQGTNLNLTYIAIAMIILIIITRPAYTQWLNSMSQCSTKIPHRTGILRVELRKTRCIKIEQDI